MLAKLRDLIFPIFCVGCGREGSWLCARCALLVPFRITSRPSHSPLARIVALIPYRDKLSQRLIGAYKFRRAWSAADSLASLVRRGLVPALVPGVELVAPVPLHWRRQYERGYNQSAVLARAAASVLGVSCDENLLVRAHGGGAQSKKTDRDREKPLKSGTFLVRNPERTRGRHILLVDDVVTRGETMRAAAASLVAVGAARVTGLALTYGG